MGGDSLGLDEEAHGQQLLNGQEVLLRGDENPLELASDCGCTALQMY